MVFHAKAVEVYSSAFQTLESYDLEKDLEVGHRHPIFKGSIPSHLRPGLSPSPDCLHSRLPSPPASNQIPFLGPWCQHQSLCPEGPTI